MTATRTKTKKSERIVIFESDAKELTVLIKPGHHNDTPYGRTEVRPVYAEFRPSQRRNGDWVGRFIVESDEAAQRDFGLTREELLDRLRSHGGNRDYEGRVSADFWELHPSEVAPDHTPLLMDIARYAAARNGEALRELLETEREGHERPDVILTLENALELLTDSTAPQAA